MRRANNTKQMWLTKIKDCLSLLNVENELLNQEVPFVIHPVNNKNQIVWYAKLHKLMQTYISKLYSLVCQTSEADANIQEQFHFYFSFIVCQL